MAMLRPCLICGFFLFLVLPSDARVGVVGGWSPIKNMGDPHVIEIGEFAVSEHNKEAANRGVLSMRRVVKGETQVVAGTNYKLVIEATSNGGTEGKSYEAIVWEKDWEKFRKLTSFKPLN